MDQAHSLKGDAVAPSLPGSGLHAATVTGRAGQWLFVDSGVHRALRAESCLLEPETGDLVLVCDALPARPATDGVSAATTVPYVLAVLSRVQTTSATVALPGGAALTTADGALTVRAARVALQGREAVSASAPELTLHGVATDLVSQRTRVRIGTLDAGVGRLTLAARSFVSTIGRLVQRAKDSTRCIEGTDELRAGNARWKIEGHAHMHTRHTTLRSDEITRVDGSKIELG